MGNVNDVEVNVMINKTAESLKEQIKMPEWARFVKTGAGKERVPEDPNWWYTRAASILRKLYVQSPIGVNKLKKKYGCKKNRGHKPEEYREGSGKIIRVILQQFEEIGFVEKAEKGVHKGRAISAKGKSFLDKIAKELSTKNAAK